VQKALKSAGIFRFGVFEMDAATGELRKQGLRIRLQEQPSQVLLMLLDRAGEVVSREEIRRKLWPPDTFVDFDQSLGTALRKLRQALCDDADTPRYIETIPKNGFRFLLPVEKIAGVAELTQTPPPTSPTQTAPTEPKGAPGAPRMIPSLGWVVLAGACLLSFSLGWLVHTRPAALDGGGSHTRLIRSLVQPPPNWSFEHSSFSMSPDGTRLAFVAFGPDGSDKLWVRALSAPTAQQINGTDGAMEPFWSPDSKRVGFFSAGKLNVVDLDSGAVRVLAEAPFARCGGAWGRDGTIVFSPLVDGPLYRVPESGGTPTPVTRMAHASTGQRHMWPFFLPDGTHFLYADSSGPLGPQGESIFLGSLDGSDPKLISSKISGNVSYASGYLLYARDRSLWAQPFDIRRLQLSGTATPITTQEIEQEQGFAHAEFSVSENGLLVFQSLADSRTALTWFDVSGNELGVVGDSRYRDPRLSPNGDSLAVSSDDARNGKFFIRVFDLVHGSSHRLTESSNDRSPAWSPDGRRITYTTTDTLNEISADGSGPAELILKGGTYLGHMSWSADGRMMFTDFSAGLPWLKLYSTGNRRVEPYAVGAEARFSPDGKWIAYVGPLTVPDSDAIFIAPVPGPGGRIRVSSGSGAQPNWDPDGKRLFYIAPDRKLMVVEFDRRSASASAPRVLFQTRITFPNFSDTQYSVSRDGRFLINSFPANASSPLTLVTGWTTEVNGQHK